MLASSDPATFIALVFLLLLLLTCLRLQHTRRLRQEGRRRLAEATGHPSTFQRDRRPVRIGGLDGEYVAELGGPGVEVRYETNAGTEYLGRYTSDDAAIAAIADHEAAQASR